MADQNNLRQVQLQIKAFNKAWSRADSAKQLSMEYNETITSLVGQSRLTKGGYAKAGTKYLESLSDYELMALSGDIEAARNAIEVAKVTTSMNIYDIDIEDPKSAIWSMYNDLLNRGYQLDSAQVKSLADGDYDTPTVDVLKEMKKVLTQKNYGLSDFANWFDSMSNLE